MATNAGDWALMDGRAGKYFVFLTSHYIYTYAHAPQAENLGVLSPKRIDLFRVEQVPFRGILGCGLHRMRKTVRFKVSLA